MDENEVLANVSRPGWTIVSRYPHMVPPIAGSPAALAGNTSVVDGNEVWVISKPGEQPDMIVVQPGEPKQLQPGQSTSWGPGITGKTYTVITPPKNTLPAEKTAPSASSALDRLDANGQLIKPEDTTTPVAKLRDPKTGTVTDMPDPKTSPQGEYREVGGSLYLLKAGDEPKLVIANPDKTKITTFQGPNGAQYEYDPSKPAGQRTTLLVAGEKKPDVMSGEPSWADIPGTNQQQAYRIVDGQRQDIPGLTKNKAQKLIAPQDQETWTVVDENGQVISTYKNPGYKAPPPQVVTGLSTDTPYLTTRDTTTGALSTQLYPGYQAKTQADVAAQVGRLQTAAQQKRDELKARIGQAGYTAQNAARDFDQWWNQNVEPQKQGLAAAQQQAQIEQQRKADEERRTAFTTAQAAGQQAASIYQAGARNRVGPQFGNVINQLVNAWASGGTLPQNLDVAGAVTYQGPTADQIAEQATAKALAFISPTAAQIAGGGQPALTNMMPQLDINQLLQASTYSPGNFGAVPQVQAQPVTSIYRPPQQVDLTSPYPQRGPLYG